MVLGIGYSSHDAGRSRYRRTGISRLASDMNRGRDFDRRNGAAGSATNGQLPRSLATICQWMVERPIRRTSDFRLRLVIRILDASRARASAEFPTRASSVQTVRVACCVVLVVPMPRSPLIGSALHGRIVSGPPKWERPRAVGHQVEPVANRSPRLARQSMISPCGELNATIFTVGLTPRIRDATARGIHSRAGVIGQRHVRSRGCRSSGF